MIFVMRNVWDVWRWRLSVLKQRLTVLTGVSFLLVNRSIFYLTRMLRFLLLYRIASYCRQPGGGPASAQRRSQERAEAATQEKGQKGMLFGKGMNFLLLSVKGP